MQAAGIGRSRTRRMAVGAVAGSAIAAILVGTLLGILAGIGRPTAPNISSNAAMQAWTQRLEAQAEQAREARMWNAWTNRLNEQADAPGLRGMSNRAEQAWTDRLNGLAEHLLGAHGQ